MSLVTDEIRAAATEIVVGDAICQEKSKFLLTEINLPNGLLPLKDIEECGYVQETGFVWLKQKKKCEHKFQKIGKSVQYATEVTAYVDRNRIKKLTGIKAKELLMWLTLSEISVDDPPSGKILFKTPTGLSRSYPVDAFQIEGEKPAAKEEVKEKADAPLAAEIKDKVAAPPVAEIKVKVAAPPVAEIKDKVAAPPVAAAAAAVEVREV